MIVKKALFLVFISSCLTFYFGQEKTIDTVYIFDNQMKKAKLFHSVHTLSPKDIEKNSANLSEVLRFQSPMYIKENGRGAVSSPSFRGTAAQHTAFVWNGININSLFLGQGDINNIAVFGYDQMDIKSGGGSVIYGSGAIGGSVHLNNDLRFNHGFSGTFNTEIASFGTYNNFIKSAYSNDQFSFKVSGNYLISENDYEVPEKKYINRNGKFFNTTFNVGISYKIVPHQTISWQSQLYNATQNYPIFAENGNRTHYETQTLRSLLSWDVNHSKISNSLKAAYTEDNFQYFGVYNAPYTSGGGSKNYIFKNDFNYFILPKLNANIIGEFQQTQGNGLGTSGIHHVSRNVGSVAGLLRYFTSPNLRFEAGIRQDFVEDISAPFLYSFSGKWTPIHWYQVSTRFSKNFRYPSFNDLYWQPGGNLDLKSETSMQADMSHEFIAGDFKLSITPYYLHINNMIRWLPTSLGYWQAFNTDKVESYGLESQISYHKRFKENHYVKFIAGHSYTKSVDLETQKQLMYVPLHKLTSNVDYQYHFLRLFAQGIYNGITYTTSEASKKYAITPYFVMNAGISATLMKKYTLGFKVNNITDTVYETVENYPLPQRNYSINASINF